MGNIVDAGDGWLTVEVRNRFEAGDRVELVTTSGNFDFDLPAITARNGQAMDMAPGSGHVVRIPAPEGLPQGAINPYTLLVRHLPENLGEIE